MASAYEYKLFAEATTAGQSAALYFGIAVGGLMAVSVVAHWTRKLYLKMFPKTSAIRRVGSSLARPIRRAAMSTVVGGFLFMPCRMSLALAYFGVNAALTFTNVNWSQQTLFAKRLGWMALCNLCLVIFLGLKNTPLSPLAGYSYESLNVLHRCCGYTTIVYATLHSIIYVAGLAEADALYVLDDSHQYAAVVATLSFIVIFITALGVVRNKQYELFYVIHVVLVVVILATAAFHTYQPPDIALGTIVIVGVAACLWFLDRLLRLTRWIYQAVGNYCTLTPLPDGATRVTMHRSIKARPGSHVFLYVPGIRAWQNHPFTLLASQPAEFVIAGRDGFTRALHEAACRTGPKSKFRAAIEGPYGRVPDVRKYDKVVLVAGGSGATFTIALALCWARNLRSRKHKSTLDFVWVVRSTSYLEWFDSELAELQANRAVNMSVYITRSSAKEEAVWESGPGLPFEGKEKPRTQASPTTRSSTSFSLSSVTRYGRPDIQSMVQDAVAPLTSKRSVFIAGCGPDGMLTDMRVVASSLMTAEAPSIDLHLEAFEW